MYTDVVVRVTSLGSCPGLTIDAGATSWHADEPDFTLDVDGTTGTLTVLAGDGVVLRARFDSTDGDASMFFNNGRFLEYACV